MKLFAKLRGAIAAKDVDQRAVANYIGRTEPYVSRRMTGAMSWTLEEAYKIMGYLDLDPSEIYKFFPPDGVDPEAKEKIERSRSA